MAEEEKIDNGPAESDSDDSKGGLLGWIITFIFAVGCAGGGYGLSGLFAKAAPKAAVKNTSETTEEVPDEMSKIYAENASELQPWIYEFDQIIANLNVPGGSRLISVTPVIELSPEMDKVEGELFLEKKMVYLRDWLQTYLAGLTLEQVQGSTSQARMKVEIKESFNEILFPDSKPLITRVMLKGYTIQ